MTQWLRRALFFLCLSSLATYAALAAGPAQADSSFGVSVGPHGNVGFSYGAWFPLGHHSSVGLSFGHRGHGHHRGHYRRRYSRGHYGHHGRHHYGAHYNPYYGAPYYGPHRGYRSGYTVRTYSYRAPGYTGPATSPAPSQQGLAGGPSAAQAPSNTGAVSGYSPSGAPCEKVEKFERDAEGRVAIYQADLCFNQNGTRFVRPGSNQLVGYAE
jgi:hypothetical protein